MSDGCRQTGTTTEQMRAAGRNSWYIWLNAELAYPRALARRIGRGDLRIVAPDALVTSRMHGTRDPVVDHACRLQPDQESALRYFRASGR